MSSDWLYELNQFLILLGTVVIFCLVIVLGYWIGRKSSEDGEAESQINTVQGAVLGLLALLFAFTFAMAASRYDTRKQFVLLEANAIGTTYLRAQMLPEPYSEEIIDLLRKYVDTRLAFFYAGADEDKIAKAIDETENLQAQLWQEAVAVSAIDNRSIPTGLFIESLNEVIDLHSDRLAAMKNRVPEVIVYLLYMVALVTLGFLGYGIGVSRRKNFTPVIIAMVLITLILMVIIDLDRPRRGLITVSQESMIELQESIK